MRLYPLHNLIYQKWEATYIIIFKSTPTNYNAEIKYDIFYKTLNL